MLEAKSKKTVLNLARGAVEAAIRGEPIPDVRVENEELQAKVGAFVTLKTKGELRGCLGRFVSDAPLWKTVRKLAAAAATEDPRFLSNRITSEELDEVEIEVSVLSPLKKTDDPLNDIEEGKHGIYITDGTRSGCFLPQVATETGWDAEEFMDKCCTHKAGLPSGAWKHAPDTEVYIFTAEVLSD